MIIVIPPPPSLAGFLTKFFIFFSLAGELASGVVITFAQTSRLRLKASVIVSSRITEERSLFNIRFKLPLRML